MAKPYKDYLQTINDFERPNAPDIPSLALFRGSIRRYQALGFICLICSVIGSKI